VKSSSTGALPPIPPPPEGNSPSIVQLLLFYLVVDFTGDFTSPSSYFLMQEGGGILKVQWLTPLALHTATKALLIRDRMLCCGDKLSRVELFQQKKKKKRAGRERRRLWRCMRFRFQLSKHYLRTHVKSRAG